MQARKIKTSLGRPGEISGVGEHSIWLKLVEMCRINERTNDVYLPLRAETVKIVIGELKLRLEHCFYFSFLSNPFHHTFP